MDRQIPIIYLAFANKPDSPLSSLDKESKEIDRVLAVGASQKFFQLHQSPYVKTDQFLEDLQTFRNQIVIFHFGGHASSELLLFQDQEAYAEGIAQLFGLQNALKIIFLNGCSTAQQVDQLIANGVPAVVSTSKEIIDDLAATFAINFYRSLFKGLTLLEAFNSAAGSVQTVSQVFTQPHRGLDLEPNTSDKSLPWNLTVQSEDMHKWTLPKIPFEKFKFDEYRFSNRKLAQTFQVNHALVEDLANGLLPYCKKLQLAPVTSSRELMDNILWCLPTPIADQIKSVFSNDLLNTNKRIRLKRIAITYQKSIQLIFTYLFSQLWEAKIAQPHLTINKEVLMQLKLYLLGKFPNSQIPQFIQSIHHLMANRFQYSYFFNEIEPLFQQPAYWDDFKDIHKNMDTLTHAVDFETPTNEDPPIDEDCLDAELYLTAFLKDWNFLASYPFISVQDINVVKPRRKKAKFVHAQNILRYTESTDYGGYDEKTYRFFMDHLSVIVAKPTVGQDYFLNLSPFLVDYNALKGIKAPSSLYFLEQFDLDNKTLHYRHISNGDELKLLKVTDDKVQIMDDMTAPNDKVKSNRFTERKKQLQVNHAPLNELFELAEAFVIDIFDHQYRQL